jgi:hypothetical protein
VVVNPAAFERSQSGQVFGPITLRYEPRAGEPAEFPEPGWTDFVVVLLSWWLEQIETLRIGVEEEVRCGFMDGPLEFTVARQDADTYRLRCLERTRDGEDVIEDWTSPTATFDASLREAGRATLAECDRRGWASRDVATLRRALDAAIRPPAA